MEGTLLATVRLRHWRTGAVQHARVEASANDHFGYLCVVLPALGGYCGSIVTTAAGAREAISDLRGAVDHAVGQWYAIERISRSRAFAGVADGFVEACKLLLPVVPAEPYGV